MDHEKLWKEYLSQSHNPFDASYCSEMVTLVRVNNLEINTKQTKAILQPRKLRKGISCRAVAS